MMRPYVSWMAVDQSSGNSEDKVWNVFISEKDYMYSITTLGIVGFVSNLFILWILIERQMTPHLTILKSMAFVDLCQSVTVLYCVHYPRDNLLPEGLMGDLTCHLILNSYLLLALSATSAWHTVILAVELYGEANKDRVRWYNNLFGSKRNNWLVLVFIGIIGFVSPIVETWNFRAKDGVCYVHWANTWSRKLASVSQITLILVIPVIIITSCWLLLLKQLKEAQKICEEKNPFDLEMQAEYKATKAILVPFRIRTTFLLLVYIVTWLPDQTVWLIYTFNIANQHQSLLSEWYSELAWFLPVFNAILNPIIYGWTWKNFRFIAIYKVKKLFTCSAETLVVNESVLVDW